MDGCVYIDPGTGIFTLLTAVTLSGKRTRCRAALEGHIHVSVQVGRSRALFCLQTYLGQGGGKLYLPYHHSP